MKRKLIQHLTSGAALGAIAISGLGISPALADNQAHKITGFLEGVVNPGVVNVGSSADPVYHLTTDGQRAVTGLGCNTNGYIEVRPVAVTAADDVGIAFIPRRTADRVGANVSTYANGSQVDVDPSTRSYVHQDGAPSAAWYAGVFNVVTGHPIVSVQGAFSQNDCSGGGRSSTSSGQTTDPGAPPPPPAGPGPDCVGGCGDALIFLQPVFDQVNGGAVNVASADYNSVKADNLYNAAGMQAVMAALSGPKMA